MVKRFNVVPFPFRSREDRYSASALPGGMLFDICVWKERKQRKREARLKTSAKRIRAHDGCLGIMRRRRTRQTAISCGEESISIDPQISEWGNPVSFIGHCTGMNSIVPAARHPGK